jgi:hypothetical protein
MLHYVGELGDEPTRFTAKLSVFHVSYKIHFLVRGKNEYFFLRLAQKSSLFSV